jgi:Flp pilus assembly protein TadG
VFDRLNATALAKDDRGGAAIEFAILAPALLVLVFGILAVGWAINGVSSVNHALERTGRALQLNPSLTSNQMLQLIRTQVDYLGTPNIAVALTVDAPSNGIKLAHVTATYNFVLDLPLLSSQSIAYSSTVTVPLVAT